MRRSLGLLAAAALLGVTSAPADVILDWNALLLDEIRTDNSSPTSGSRNLAIFHSAIYDSVNSITRTHQPYKFQLDPPAEISIEAAAVGAAYQVAVDLYPSLAGWADELYQSWLTNAPASTSLSNGFAFGQTIGRLAIQARAADGSSTDVPYIPSSAPGEWQRTPPFFRPPLTPQWRYVTPFCLPSTEPFVPGPPPALDSPEYAQALNEVKALGGQTGSIRTTEQSQIAVFWSDFSYTAMPPGHWHEIAATIAKDRHNSLEQNARMFALLSLAEADSAIVCWETKYRYNLWRPCTAIQRANEDNNPATVPDTNWASYLVCPPFPSFTSGHSTFSKAAALVLAAFYGTDRIAFGATSDAMPGVVRAFDSLSACADEIGMSRIYGGIHFQFDNLEGKLAGGKIGEYIAANYLLGNDRLPLVYLVGFSNSIPLVRVHGHIGANFTLQASSNLTAWTTVATDLAMPGGVLIGDTAGGSGAASRFYRAAEAPPTNTITVVNEANPAQVATRPTGLFSHLASP